MNAELLLPAEADVLREALVAWTERERPAVPAAERLRRIRAQMKIAKVRPMYATAREPKVSRLSWLAAACAAAVLAAACAGWLYHTLGQPAAPVVQDEIPQVVPSAEKPKDGLERAPVPELPAEVAVASNPAPGLYRQGDGNRLGWEPVQGAVKFRAGTVLQVASNAQPAELTLGGLHRVKIDPGSVVRLPGSNAADRPVASDPARPLVELWRGRIEVHAQGGALELAGRMGKERRPVVLRVLGDDEFAVMQSRDMDQAAARHAEQDGFTLLDTEVLPPVEYSITVDHQPKPEDVRVQQGTANLLNTIDADLQDVPVAEAMDNLVALINVRIRLSDAARKAAGEKLITLKVEKLTGAEALSKFCAQAGLTFHIEQGEIVLRLPNEPQTVPVPENPEF